MSDDFNAAFRDFVKRGKLPSPNRGERLEIRVSKRGMAYDSKPQFKIVSDEAMNEWDRQKAKFKSQERARHNAAKLALDEQQNLQRPSRQVGYERSTSAWNGRMGPSAPHATSEYTNGGVVRDDDPRRLINTLGELGYSDDEVNTVLDALGYGSEEDPDESENWEEQEHVAPRSEKHGPRSRVSDIEEDEEPEQKKPERLGFKSNSRDPYRMSHGSTKSYLGGEELKRPPAKDRRRNAHDELLAGTVALQMRQNHPRMSTDSIAEVLRSQFRFDWNTATRVAAGSSGKTPSSGFMQRFPDAERIGTNPSFAARVSPLRTDGSDMAKDTHNSVSFRASQGFADRFPEAAHIRLGGASPYAEFWR